MTMPQHVQVNAVPDEHIARRLAEFAQCTFRSELPPHVQECTRRLFVDQVGLQIGCANLPWSRSVYDYVRTFSSPGSSTVLHYGDKLHPELAAFANATFGHGQDFDDTCQIVQTHAGAVVVPVALAIGEHVGASGQEVMTAAAAGLEIMLRAALSVSPDCLKRGHHTPPAAGPFGAATTAGLLLGLGSAQLAEALAVAGSFSGGLTEYTQAGGSVKRIHTAIPTTAGIRAAALAQRGISGPRTVFEGVKGFCNVFADNPTPELLTARLGSDYLITQIGLKAYNCCYFIHSPLEAFMSTVTSNNLLPDDIAVVDVLTSEHASVHVGTIVHPTDPLGAQFSVQFTLAMSLLEEIPTLHSYTIEQLTNPRLHEFADRVRVAVDPVAESEYPSNWGALVRIRTIDGRVFEERNRFPRGSPANPMTDQELWDKFEVNLAGLLPADRVESLQAALCSLDTLQSVRTLADLAAVPPSRSHLTRPVHYQKGAPS